jgi:hypothetical protein
VLGSICAFRSFSQKINKETSESINMPIRANGHDRHLQSIPLNVQYTFFSADHGTFSKIDHILGHKANLNNFKKIEITPWIKSDHNRIKQKKKTAKEITENIQTHGD